MRLREKETLLYAGLPILEFFVFSSPPVPPASAFLSCLGDLGSSFCGFPRAFSAPFVPGQMPLPTVPTAANATLTFLDFWAVPAHPFLKADYAELLSTVPTRIQARDDEKPHMQKRGAAAREESEAPTEKSPHKQKGGAAGTAEADGRDRGLGSAAGWL